ncbi:DUF5119 domain-containing protein [uncultured Bacteroides sp.]|uniref:DUF5119 domain-containing protein n=1 Tax=uncultured Bacteroides sp. TaxID=162156 RepID=UPI0025D7450D|nr:DUF5119 domain-containing protein [uncultured Bacteroides sp.]
MRNRMYMFLLLLSGLSVLLTGCSFRDMLDDYPVSGVQIKFNWEGVTDELPEGMRVIFYPKSEEGRKVESYLSVEGGEVKVPPGYYDVVIYNYNTECVQIRGDGAYETIEAYTGYCSGLDTSEKMVWAPDPLYVVSMNDMRIEKSEDVLLMEFQPRLVVRHYSFEIKVKGLKNVASIVCNVDGMNGSYCMSDGTCTSSIAPIYVEANRGDDVLRGSFSAFSAPTFTSTRAGGEVTMKLLLIKVDNTVQEVKVDITKAVAPPPPPSGGEEEPEPETDIEIPIDEEIEVDDVEVPPGGGGGIGGDVGDWDDETNVELPVE